MRTEKEYSFDIYFQTATFLKTGVCINFSYNLELSRLPRSIFKEKDLFVLLERYLRKISYLEVTIPPASVRAFLVLAGPIPPELTADTTMTYLV